jgi:hypothetical protein
VNTEKVDADSASVAISGSVFLNSGDSHATAIPVNLSGSCPPPFSRVELQPVAEVVAALNVFSGRSVIALEAGSPGRECLDQAESHPGPTLLLPEATIEGSPAPFCSRMGCLS